MLMEKNLFESRKTLYLRRRDADLPLKFKKTALTLLHFLLATVRLEIRPITF